MATDRFNVMQSGLASPAANIADVSLHDSNLLDPPCRALHVKTTSGLVKVTTVDGTTATVYIAQGQVFPIRARVVWSTGTTAIGVVALY